jgi:hypothetical protein
VGKYVFVALYTIKINPFYTTVFQNINTTLHAVEHASWMSSYNLIYRKIKRKYPFTRQLHNRGGM